MPTSSDSADATPRAPRPDIDALVAAAMANWCAVTHRHGMLPEQRAAIEALAALARTAVPPGPPVPPDPERQAAREDEGGAL